MGARALGLAAAAVAWVFLATGLSAAGPARFVPHREVVTGAELGVTMAGFEARDVAEVAAILDSLARRAAALAQTPVRQHFPVLAEAHEAGVRWDEAREVFAMGLERLARALGEGEVA